jgi:hypothetical protein
MEFHGVIIQDSIVQTRQSYNQENQKVAMSILSVEDPKAVVSA